MSLLSRAAARFAYTPYSMNWFRFAAGWLAMAAFGLLLGIGLEGSPVPSLERVEHNYPVIGLLILSGLYQREKAKTHAVGRALVLASNEQMNRDKAAIEESSRVAAAQILAPVEELAEVDRLKRDIGTLVLSRAALLEAVIRAARAAGTLGDTEPTEPEQFLLIPAVLGEEAARGNVLRAQLEALFPDLNDPTKSESWIGGNRLREILDAKAPASAAAAGFGAAPALLDLVGRIGKLTRELRIEVPLEHFGDPLAKLARIGQLAAEGLKASKTCAFCGDIDMTVPSAAIAADGRRCCYDCAKACPAPGCGTHDDGEGNASHAGGQPMAPGDEACRACAARIDRATTIRGALRLILNPKGDSMSSRWITEQINAYLLERGPAGVSVSVEDVEKELRLDPEMRLVSGDLWRRIG